MTHGGSGLPKSGMREPFAITRRSEGWEISSMNARKEAG
jgi:hypothetical protein